MQHKHSLHGFGQQISGGVNCCHRKPELALGCIIGFSFRFLVKPINGIVEVWNSLSFFLQALIGYPSCLDDRKDEPLCLRKLCANRGALRQNPMYNTSEWLWKEPKNKSSDKGVNRVALRNPKPLLVTAITQGPRKTLVEILATTSSISS